jgi:toxin-antitoxin system PIN domain toxin
MILLDVNLLLYAVNDDLPQSPRARAWLEEVLSGSRRVGLPWVVILAFLRLTTNPRVFEHPLTIERASAYIDEWLALPVVRPVIPGHGHWMILSNLLAVSGAGGNLTTDAHLAALALEQGYTLYSTDSDFKRFSGLRHVNPLLE